MRESVSSEVSRPEAERSSKKSGGGDLVLALGLGLVCLATRLPFTGW